LLTSEFDKLGLSWGEAFISSFESRSNIGKNPMFLNAAGMFDLAKFKEY
jgi:peptidyl-prolyl cis-trans isomerase D